MIFITQFNENLMFPQILGFARYANNVNTIIYNSKRLTNVLIIIIWIRTDKILYWILNR